MKVVLDTNVVVSAFLSPPGKPAAILRSVLRHDLDICYDAAILAEYEDVLTRSKFAGIIFAPAVQRFFEIIFNIGININVAPSRTDFPDETDRKFFDVARATGAFLVTRNKKHYPEESFILDPAEFLEILP